jgi:hypothetical protein
MLPRREHDGVVAIMAGPLIRAGGRATRLPVIEGTAAARNLTRTVNGHHVFSGTAVGAARTARRSSNLTVVPVACSRLRICQR